MATKPTPGGSDGTYGTELNVFLDESLASDGKVKDGAVFSTSAAPTVDAGVANKLYVDNGGERSVQGVAAVVFTKYLTGNLDADSQTAIAHGVANSATKLLSVSVLCFDDTNSNWIPPCSGSIETARSFLVSTGVANVLVFSVGANLQGHAYRVRIDYIL